MIDTICLKIPFSRVDCVDNENLFSVKIPYLSYGVASRVDTSGHQDIYVPSMVVKKLQYTDFKATPHSYYDATFFYITFSVAKLFYGENLSEVCEKDFKKVVTKLHVVMAKCGIYIKEEYIENAEVRSIDYSKNIILRHTTTAKAIQILNSGYINKLHNKYREYVNDGQQVLFNSGTNALTFYNKRLELKHNCRQLKYDGELRDAQAQAWLSAKNKEILRIEVRLKNVKKIKDLCSRLELLPYDKLSGALKFKTLFKESIAKGIILDYFQKVYYSIAIPKKETLILIAEKILEDKNIAPRRKFNNIGAALCLLHFGRNVAVDISYKNTLEIEKIIRKIKKSEDRDEEANPLDEIFNQIERFDLIYGLESGQLTEEDEDVIGYRKRAFTEEEEEAIYGEALRKYLPKTNDLYLEMYHEMLEVNGDRPFPDTNEKALLLYYEYQGVKREKELQRRRGESGEVSGVIDNPNFKEKKKKSSEDKEESLDETRKWIEEKFKIEREKRELKREKEQRKADYEEKLAREQELKAEKKLQEQKDEITLLTPEEMYADDPYGLEMWYYNDKIAKETLEERKVREERIAEQERRIREIERTARNIKIYDGPREELKRKQEGSNVIYNPNFRGSKQEESNKTSAETESSCNQSQYNDSS